MDLALFDFDGTITVTGTYRYVGGDCCGTEKSERISRRYTLTEYPTIYAYGDTDEDHDMLAIADRRYLRWQEIGDIPTTARSR